MGTFKDEMNILNDIVGTIDFKMAADETFLTFQQLNEVFNEEMIHLQQFCNSRRSSS